MVSIQRIQRIQQKEFFCVPSTATLLNRCPSYHFSFTTSPRTHSPKNSLASRTSPTYNPCVHMIFSDDFVDSFRFCCFVLQSDISCKFAISHRTTNQMVRWPSWLWRQVKVILTLYSWSRKWRGFKSHSHQHSSRSV